MKKRIAKKIRKEYLRRPHGTYTLGQIRRAWTFRPLRVYVNGQRLAPGTHGYSDAPGDLQITTFDFVPDPAVDMAYVRTESSR